METHERDPREREREKAAAAPYLACAPDVNAILVRGNETARSFQPANDRLCTFAGSDGGKRKHAGSSGESS